MKKCKRNGCRKDYNDDENNQNSCEYHPGKPIFHDTKKGWTCCNKIVYDWEEFEKIPPCATANHSNVKQDQGNQFFKSNTVDNAEKGLKKHEAGVVIKDINAYNKDLEEKKKTAQEAKLAAEGGERKLFYTKKGNLKCVNQGCGKEFKEEDNHEDACEFHKGNPVFHDCKKYWTCCGKQTMDWDQFMKLPKCCKGFHSPKYQ